MLTRQVNGACDLGSIKRLRQYVPRAQIQSFRPKPVVGESRCNDQGRGIGLVLQVYEYFTPIARHPIVIKHYHAYIATPQNGQCAGHIDRSSQFAVTCRGACLQEPMVGVMPANG